MASRNPTGFRPSRGSDAALSATAHLFLAGDWAWNQAIDCLPLLVKAGADLSAKDNLGKTPLHYLAEQETPHPGPISRLNELGGILSSARIHWDAPNHAGETPRVIMARQSNQWPRMFRPSPETDIFDAISRDNREAVGRLLKADPQLVHQTNRAGRTPLGLAVELRNTNMVRFLETHGAKWDALSAVKAGRPDALRTSLRRQPSAVTNRFLSKSLLHLAAAKGDLESVKILTASKGDLQALDQWGLSPLGRATIAGHKPVQDFLLQQGAKESFMDAVYQNDLPKVADWLEKYQLRDIIVPGSRVTPLGSAIAAGHTGVMELLWKHATSPNSLSVADAQNAAHIAAYYNRSNALDLLIRRGVDINQKDGSGLAPLHWAAMRGSMQAASLLLANRADINLRVDQEMAVPRLSLAPRQSILQNTPLHMAVLFKETNLVQWLVQSGADVNAANALQQTSLDLARDHPLNSLVLSRLWQRMPDFLEPFRTGYDTPPKWLDPRCKQQRISQKTTFQMKHFAVSGV